MTQFRVLHVVESTTAGVKSHVLSLVTHIDRDRFAVGVACPQVRTDAYGDVSFVEDLKAYDVPCHIVDIRRSIHPVYDLRAVAQLHQVIRCGEYQIVHAHSSKAGFLGRVAARMAGVTVILYTPNGFAFRVESGWRRWLYVTAESLAARWTDAIICSSDGERALVLREGIAHPDQLLVIENAINPQPFTGWADAIHRNSLNGPTIGTVSRLVEGKGLRTLLYAAVKLSETSDAAQVVVVGDGELRTELEGLARNLGIAERVDFLGFQPDVRPLVNAFDIFVLPTRYEAGVPFAVLEAMAMGKPVITTQAEGLERLQDSGAARLVPMDDVEALANAMRDLWRDPAERRRLGEAGRALVQAEYAISDKVQRIERLYEGTAEDCRRVKKQV